MRLFTALAFGLAGLWSRAVLVRIVRSDRRRIGELLQGLDLRPTGPICMGDASKRPRGRPAQSRCLRGEAGRAKAETFRSGDPLPTSAGARPDLPRRAQVQGDSWSSWVRSLAPGPSRQLQKLCPRLRQASLVVGVNRGPAVASAKPPATPKTN